MIAKVELSVLIPFFRDDPRPLLAALDAEAAGFDGQVEIIVLDDAGGDAALSANVAETVAGLRAPARLIQLTTNEGRARGRNRLAAAARADRLLFLDSDMLPDRPDFLSAYLELLPSHPAVVVGGFSVTQCVAREDHALHRAMAARADCLPAAVRALTPEKYVFTSNLMVRRDVFDAEAFDEGFHGWGWEDVEWGAKSVAAFPFYISTTPPPIWGWTRRTSWPANTNNRYKTSPDWPRATPILSPAIQASRLHGSSRAGQAFSIGAVS